MSELARASKPSIFEQTEKVGVPARHLKSLAARSKTPGTARPSARRTAGSRASARSSGGPRRRKKRGWRPARPREITIRKSQPRETLVIPGVLRGESSRARRIIYNNTLHSRTLVRWLKSVLVGTCSGTADSNHVGRSPPMWARDNIEVAIMRN